MEYRVNQKLAKLQPYNPNTDGCSIHLDANESFLELPEEIREKISAGVSSAAFNRYPDPSAAGVRRAFGNYAGVGEEFVTAGNGSDELISLLFGSFLQKGEKALILEPDFSMYRFYCFINECEPVILKQDENLRFTPEELIKTARENNVRLVIFSNPCNPTGQGIGREEVMKIVDALSCLVVVDEAYMDFWGQSVAAEAPGRSNMIVLKTCSKMGFAALRLGFAVACPYLTGYLRSAKSPYNVNSLTQAAGEAVLSETGYLHRAAAEIARSRDELYKALKALEEKDFRVFPSVTNFVTARSEKASEIHQKLQSAGISVRLLGGKYLRITAGSREENAALAAALKTILHNGKGCD